MKALELARYLSNYMDDAEVFIEDEDGLLHDFRCEDRPMVFDGFDSVYDEGINIKKID